MPAKGQLRPIGDRLWEKVEKTETCWLWTAKKHPRGYGHIWSGGSHGRTLQAHRVAYELLKGPIPEGLTLDHLCRNTSCVNPDHLEPVTMSVNLLRGDGLPAKNARKTHCHRGHEFTAKNTYTRPNGQRQCRICKRAEDRERRGLATC